MRSISISQPFPNSQTLTCLSFTQNLRGILKNAAKFIGPQSNCYYLWLAWTVCNLNEEWNQLLRTVKCLRKIILSATYPKLFIKSQWCEKFLISKKKDYLPEWGVLPAITDGAESAAAVVAPLEAIGDVVVIKRGREIGQIDLVALIIANVDGLAGLLAQTNTLERGVLMELNIGWYSNKECLIRHLYLNSRSIRVISTCIFDKRTEEKYAF